MLVILRYESTFFTVLLFYTFTTSTEYPKKWNKLEKFGKRFDCENRQTLKNEIKRTVEYLNGKIPFFINGKVSKEMLSKVKGSTFKIH